MEARMAFHQPRHIESQIFKEYNFEQLEREPLKTPIARANSQNHYLRSPNSPSNALLGLLNRTTLKTPLMGLNPTHKQKDQFLHFK
ncbi:hypothetical protein FF1_031681 [Malus domestica]